MRLRLLSLAVVLCFFGCDPAMTPDGGTGGGSSASVGGGTASTGGGSASTGGGTASTGGGTASTGGGTASTGGGTASTGGGTASTGGGTASTGGGTASTGGGTASTGGGTASTGGGTASTGGGTASTGGGSASTGGGTASTGGGTASTGGGTASTGGGTASTGGGSASTGGGTASTGGGTASTGGGSASTGGGTASTGGGTASTGGGSASTGGGTASTGGGTGMDAGTGGGFAAFDAGSCGAPCPVGICQQANFCLEAQGRCAAVEISRASANAGTWGSTMFGPTACRYDAGTTGCNTREFSNPFNLAALDAGAAPAVTSGTIVGFAIHQPQHLNDGFYGNGASWVASNIANPWLKIDLGRVYSIDRVVYGRDRLGTYSSDRPTGSVKVLLAMDDHSYAEGDAGTDAVDYRQVYESFGKPVIAPISGALVLNFPPAMGRYVKLQLTSPGAGLDEVEVFGCDPALGACPGLPLNDGSVCHDPTGQSYNGTCNANAVCVGTACAINTWDCNDNPNDGCESSCPCAGTCRTANLSGFGNRCAAVASSLSISDAGASLITGSLGCTDGGTAPGCNYREFENTLNFAALDAGAAPAVTSGSLNLPIHRPWHVNDGRYGNGGSWVSSLSGASWVKVDLGRSYSIDMVTFGRDRLANFADRPTGTVKVYVSDLDNSYNEGDSTTDATDYALVYDSVSQVPTVPAGNTVIVSFPPVMGRFVKLAMTGGGVAIDELEVFGCDPRFASCPAVQLPNAMSCVDRTGSSWGGACSAGQCVSNWCPPNQWDCNGITADGCESSTRCR